MMFTIYDLAGAFCLGLAIGIWIEDWKLRHTMRELSRKK